MGSTNFLPFNENGHNQEADAAYASDSLRTNGAPSGSILPSNNYNKTIYQAAMMISALAAALTSKGYSPQDGTTPYQAAPTPTGPQAALAGVLANIMTAADMTPYALLNSPIFIGTPQAPTPATGDDSNLLATTAFVQNEFLNGFQIILGPTGMIKLPALLGSFILQWAIGSGIPANSGSTLQTVNWARAFPNACLSALVSTQVATGGNVWDCLWQAIDSPTKTGITVNLEQVGDELSGNLTCPLVWALGY